MERSSHSKSKKKKKKHKKKEDSVEWIEKGAASESEPEELREEWMRGPLENDPLISALQGSSSMRRSRADEKREIERKEKEDEAPGRSSRELNPYWKDGGSGLPEQIQTIPEDAKKVQIGDCGVGKLRKALEGCKRKAAITGRRLEQVAAEEYGSLDRLEYMLREAEHALKKRKQEVKQNVAKERLSEHRPTLTGRRFLKPGDSRSAEETGSGEVDRRTDNWRKEDHLHRRTDRTQGHLGYSNKRNFEDNHLRHDSSKSGFTENYRHRRSSSRDSSSDSDVTLPRKSHDHRELSPADNSPKHDGAQEYRKEPSIKSISADEMNKLHAKLLRAEIMGKQEMVAKYKKEIENSVVGKEEDKASETNKEILLTEIDRQGNVRPLEKRVAHERETRHHKRKRRKEMHDRSHNKDGSRNTYFPEDDSLDLAALVHREKSNTAEDMACDFARYASKVKTTDKDYQLDDAVLDKAATSQSRTFEVKDTIKAIADSKKLQDSMESCRFCFDSVKMHLVVATGTKCYLCLPDQRSIDGHCLIVPMQHISAGNMLDEDVWQEMMEFRRSLVKMFSADDQDCVFMETAMRLKRFPHMTVECIPMPKEIGELSPIYFKKAIMESGPEWAQNKRLVDLKGSDVRHKVPKGFPYFAVDWGLCSGYATTIENEEDFPYYFGRSIVGGMLDLEPTLWRKPKRDSVEEQKAKVAAFKQDFKTYDFTIETVTH